MTRVFIGIGSNVGDRRGHLERARSRLARLPDTRLTGFSPIYETAPVGPIPQENFLNAVAELETRLEPRPLLDHLHAIEKESGREPENLRTRWGPRSLDLDILLFGDRVLSDQDLVIPHPMMHERWFVLRPLADLAPNVMHPVLEMTVATLLQYVEQPPDRPKEPLSPPPGENPTNP